MNDLRFIGPTERMLYLTGLPLVRELDLASLAVIAEHAAEFTAPEGHVFVQAGRSIESVYFLVSGEVDVTWEGHTVRRSAPWTIGMEAVFTGERVSRQAVAASYCITLALPTTVILDMLSSNPHMIAKLLHKYATQRLSTEQGLPLVSKLQFLPPDAPLSPTERMRLMLHTTPGTLDFDGSLSLLHDLQEHTLPAGSQLWGTLCYVILLSGSVCMQTHDQTIELDGPIDFGWVSILADRATHATVVALTEVRVLTSTAESVLSALEHGPGLSRALLTDLVVGSMLHNPKNHPVPA